MTAGNVDTTHPFVAVDLAGKRKVTINRVKVSAMLTPAPAEPEVVPLAADPDSGSRFTALRRSRSRCASRPAPRPRRSGSGSHLVRPTPSRRIGPRPVAPDLTMRSFTLTKTARPPPSGWSPWRTSAPATPAYAGEQDNDPINDTDCKTGSDRGTIVHAAELQVFSKVVKKTREGTPSHGRTGGCDMGTHPPVHRRARVLSEHERGLDLRTWRGQPGTDCRRPR